MLPPIFQNADKLSDKSVAMYKSRIRTIIDTAARIDGVALNSDDDVNALIKRINRDPKYFEQIVRKLSSVNSRTPREYSFYDGYVGAWMAMQKHNPHLNKDLDKDERSQLSREWREMSKKIRDSRNDDREDRRKLEKYDSSPSLDDIVDLRKKLPKGDILRLIIALYTDIPCLRNDFHDICLYVSTIPEDGTPNYIAVDADWTTGVLVLHEFKTAKYYNDLPLAIKLPKSLVQEIKQYRDANMLHGKPTLFVNRDNKAYTDKAFSKLVTRSFHKHLQKHVNIMLLRHLCVMAYFDSTREHIYKLARIMGHTVKTSLEYDWDVEDPDLLVTKKLRRKIVKKHDPLRIDFDAVLEKMIPIITS